VIAEGNYLLLDRPPWSDLANLFDVTVMVTVPEEVLRERLAERWRSYELPAEQVTAKVEENDLPNGRLVVAHSIESEFVINF
jgi:pantothenate kinase